MSEKQIENSEAMKVVFENVQEMKNIKRKMTEQSRDYGNQVTVMANSAIESCKSDIERYKEEIKNNSGFRGASKRLRAVFKSLINLIGGLFRKNKKIDTSINVDVSEVGDAISSAKLTHDIIFDKNKASQDLSQSTEESSWILNKSREQKEKVFGKLGNKNADIELEDVNKDSSMRI